MSIIYKIDNTSGTLSFDLAPGELDGPGGVTRNSDLRLYGVGSLQWGEGVNENILRIAESFAVAAKELNDYNPFTQANDYDPSNDPPLPKSEEDLAPGQGITVPLDGQLWYDQTTKQLYVFESDFDLTTLGYPGFFGKWSVVGSKNTGISTPPSIGDLWYDLSYVDSGCLTQPQLKVYNPSHPDAVGGWVLVCEDFIRQCGDTMTGQLVMQSTINMSNNRILNVGDPTSGTNALNRRTGDNRYLNVVGDTMQGTINMSNYRITNVGNATNGGDAISRTFGDTRYVNISGDLMTGWLQLRPQIPIDDWYAVPVRMLNDAVDTLTNYVDSSIATTESNLQQDITDVNARITKHRVYQGQTTIAMSASGTTNVLINCDSWVTHYNTTYGESTTANQWMWIVNVNLESVLVSNGKPELPSGTPSGTPLSLGEHSGLKYFSRFTSSSLPSSAAFTITVGSLGVNSSGQEFTYNTKGESTHRITILGYPPDTYVIQGI